MSETEAQTNTLELLKHQQKQHEDQRALIMGILEQQKLNFETHRKEIAALRQQQRSASEAVAVPKASKPLLQKLIPEDDIEHS